MSTNGYDKYQSMSVDEMVRQLKRDEKALADLRLALKAMSERLFRETGS